MFAARSLIFSLILPGGVPALARREAMEPTDSGGVAVPSPTVPAGGPQVSVISDAIQFDSVRLEYDVEQNTQKRY